MPWLSTHMFYHDSRTALLRDLVAPLLHSLEQRSLVDDYFFIRYWLGGPHVRLRLHLRSQHLEPVQDEIVQACARYFSRYPSESTVSAEAYAQHAKALLNIEALDTEVASLQPNNSVQFIPYVPELRRYGVATISAVEKHFGDSSRIALGILEASPEHAAHRNIALQMMLTAVASCGTAPNILLKRISGYQAFWNGVFGDQLGHYTTQFEAKYQRQAVALQAHTRSLLALSERMSDLPENTSLKAWLVSIAELRAALGERLAKPTPDNIASIVMQCIHTHNNRLGISLYEEAYLASLLTLSVRDLIREAGRAGEVQQV